MNAWTAVDEPFIRPTARLNHWTPHVQPHGPGMKFNRGPVGPDLARNRAATTVRIPFRSKSTFRGSHTVPRSKSMDNLNLVEVANPEVLDFGQKRQLVSDHIRANRMSGDENAMRSRGLYRPVLDKPRSALSSKIFACDFIEKPDKNLIDRNPSPVYHLRIMERIRKDQERLNAFYSSLTTEVLSAPLSVHLSVRPVIGVIQESDSFGTTQSYEWQSIGQGHLVVIAHYKRQRWRELSKITVQLCQPTILTPLWCARLAIPVSKSKSGEYKQRSETRIKPNGHAGSDSSIPIYSRATDTNLVHFAYVYQTTARNRSYSTKSVRSSGPRNTTVSAGPVHLVSRWKFICHSFEPESVESVELDNFFRAMQTLIGCALTTSAFSQLELCNPAQNPNSEFGLQKSEELPVRSSPAKGRKSVPKRPYPRSLMISKSEISSPCMFRHLIALKPEEVEPFRRNPNERICPGGLRPNKAKGFVHRCAKMEQMMPPSVDARV